MVTQTGMTQGGRPRWPAKVLKYLLTILAAVLAYVGLRPSLGNWPAAVAAIAIIVLIIANVRQVGDGLSEIANDALEVMIWIRLRVASSNIQSFGAASLKALGFCHEALFRPVRFSTICRVRRRDAGKASPMPVVVSLGCLLLANYLLSIIPVLARSRPDQ